MNFTPAQAWEEILHVSGLTDEACEEHGHDLLDPEGPPNAPLDYTFKRLCQRHNVRDWDGVECILSEMRRINGFEGLHLPDHAVEKLVLEAEDFRDGKVRGIPTHTSAQRGTYQSTWGTPKTVLDMVRKEYGSIDFDLASNQEANKVVQAEKFYTAQNPCPTDPPFTGGVVWCNPPGPGRNVEEFWQVWQRCVKKGCKGAFLIFNIDHWRQLPAPFRDMAVTVLRKRLRFVGAAQGASFPSALVFSDGFPEGEGHTVLWSHR